MDGHELLDQPSFVRVGVITSFGGEMTPVHEAWSLPRGEIVVAIHDGNRADPEVVAECITHEEAEQRAAELNTASWLADRPADAAVMEWGDNWTERLMQILDKPYELELLAAA